MKFYSTGMIFGGVLLGLLFSFGTASFANTSCPAQFEKLIAKGFLSREDDHFKYYQLGGGFNGTVYRVESKSNGKEYVQKVFKAGLSSGLANDVKGFALIENFVKSEHAPMKVVKIIKQQDDRTLLLEYTKGLTLKDFMKNPNISAGSKEKISHEYTQLLQKFDHYVQKNTKVQERSFFDAFEPTEHQLSFELEDKSLSEGYLLVYIHNENIIINPETLEMTLIDPY